MRIQNNSQDLPDTHSYFNNEKSKGNCHGAFVTIYLAKTLLKQENRK
jgi:hypothetical protein